MPLCKHPECFRQQIAFDSQNGHIIWCRRCGAVKMLRNGRWCIRNKRATWERPQMVAP